MSANGKLKVGMYWASSCGGCDVSLLEIGERLLDLFQLADVVFWPCAADFKYADVAGYPDGHIDLCFYNGGVRNSEQEHIARLLRQKSRTLVAYGACASDGGIPALANFTTPRAIFDTVYHNNPSIDNPERVEPQPVTEAEVGTLEIPEFYPGVMRLRDLIHADYELPGCPPNADRVWETIVNLVTGAMAANNGGGRTGCSDKTLCEECPRTKRLKKITAFRRHHQFRPEQGWCLLEQGVLCMGPATRGGCGAACLSAGMRCEGCYGPPPNVRDQGAAMIGALGCMLDASTEEQAGTLVSQILDATGTLYRFSTSSSFLKARR